MNFAVARKLVMVVEKGGMVGRGDFISQTRIVSTILN